jgi:hypothetical protein
MCIPAILSAQTNGVTVENLVVNPGSPTTVTFNVSWEPLAPPAVWSDTVWVFVDYNDAGTMKRLLLSEGATLTATSAPDVGKVEQLTGNNKGVRVIGNARTNSSFSATVQLLTATTNVAGACAYASNYPPVAEYATASSITFTGAPPFDLVLSTGNVSVQTGYELVGSQTLVAFTDKTGAPGIIKCIPMTGGLNFSVPGSVSKGQPTSFAVTAQPTEPSASAITYTWSAPNFVPDTYTGTPFNATAPTTANTYPVTLTAHSTSYCELVETKNVTVLDCINMTMHDLTASASGFCEDATIGVSFALSSTEIGRKYQLYRDGNIPTGNELTGTGSSLTFSGTFTVAGTYTARTVAEGQYCATVMNGTYPITSNPLPEAPVISQPADVCLNAGTLVFEASGYSGTLEWTSVTGGATKATNSVTYNGASAGLKTVRARSAQSYTNAPTCYSNTVTSSATVIDHQLTLPRVSISPNKIATAAGLTVTLSTNMLYPCTNCAYQWSTGATGSSISVIVPAVGVSQTYACSVTHNAICPAYALTATVTGKNYTPPSASYPTTVCQACCWDGTTKTWVDCIVTTNAYPFNSSTDNKFVQYTTDDISPPSYTLNSAFDGKSNSDLYNSSTFTAVQLCKALGAKWYLPAIEELNNMTVVTNRPPLNGLPAPTFVPYSSQHLGSTTITNIEWGRRESLLGGNPYGWYSIRSAAYDYIWFYVSPGSGYVRCARWD